MKKGSNRHYGYYFLIFIIEKIVRHRNGKKIDLGCLLCRLPSVYQPKINESTRQAQYEVYTVVLHSMFLIDLRGRVARGLKDLSLILANGGLLLRKAALYC